MPTPRIPPPPTRPTTVSVTPADPVVFAEHLPLALVNVLERRYLSGFEPSAWHLTPRPTDLAVPLLRQVLELGRNRLGGESGRAMPHVLTACHDPGHATLLVLHGTGTEHRVYVGGRRLLGAAGGATPDFLQTQDGALRAHFGGLRLGPVTRWDMPELADLTDLIDTGRAIGAITGVPSGRGGRFPSDGQSLDRLVRAIGGRKYVLMVIAEPLTHQEVESTIDRCRRLRGDIHSYIRQTQSRNEGTSETGVTGTTGRQSSRLPVALSGMGLFLHALGILIPGIGLLGGVVDRSAYIAHLSEMREQANVARHRSTTTSSSESGSVELLDANAEACDRMLQRYLDRLQSARASGWWQTAVYVVGETEGALQAVAAAIRSTASGDMSDADPLRLVELPASLIRPAVQSGQLWRMVPVASTEGHPLGEAHNNLSTCLTSDELAVMINLPVEEVAGLRLRDTSDFAVTVPHEVVGVELGRVQDPTGRLLAPVTITADALNRHVFVTGITGSGKTNTCMRLLLEAHEKFGTPFLVVEPAKTEYRALAGVSSLRCSLRVYTIGAGAPTPLRLNPLAPVQGIGLGRHIDLLKAVFNASFPMFAGMNYVLEEALHRVYQERGWNLFDSTNPFLGPNPSPDRIASLTPTLEDLHDCIETVLTAKKYSQEIHQNLGAALRSRLHSLTVGNKGLVLNCRQSVPPEDLYSRPAIIELQELGDDEEKSFVMALLFVNLYQFAEVRHRGVRAGEPEQLRHLTLIEEAHRLLTASRGPAGPDVGDPRGKAVSMFTDMMAEMRALGEGFVVADQIPTKLAPEILKNSSLKVVHRLVSPDDRAIAGGCLNLSERQSRNLNNLTCGLAVVHDERIGEAVLVRVEPVKGSCIPQGLVPLPTIDDPAACSYLHRHPGCRECPRPCHFFHKLQNHSALSINASELTAFARMLPNAGPDVTWGAWSTWRRAALGGSGSDQQAGLAYCAATNAARSELGRLALARETQSGERAVAARLVQDHLSAAAARLLGRWVVASEFDPVAHAALDDFRRVVRDALFRAPPIEKPGCSGCPNRCRALVWVGPALSSLDKALEAAALSKQPPSRRLEMLQSALDPLVRRDESLSVHIGWKGLAYCAVVNSELLSVSNEQRHSLLKDLYSVDSLNQ